MLPYGMSTFWQAEEKERDTKKMGQETQTRKIENTSRKNISHVERPKLNVTYIVLLLSCM